MSSLEDMEMKHKQFKQFKRHDLSNIFVFPYLFRSLSENRSQDHPTCKSSIHKTDLVAARTKDAMSCPSNSSLIFKRNFVISGPKYLTQHLAQHQRLYESAHGVNSCSISFASIFCILVNANKQNYKALLIMKSKHFLDKNTVISTTAVATVSLPCRCR